MDVDVVDKNAATGGGDGSVEGKSLARGEFLDDIPDALTQTELIQRRREKISQLLDLYKEQYWVLADDLYERARSFRERNRDGENEAPTTSASAAHSETLEKHYEARVDGETELVGLAGLVGGSVEKKASRTASLPSASDLEEDIFSQKVVLDPSKATENRAARKSEAAKRLPSIESLERTALSLFSRRATKKGALACLLGKKSVFYLSRPEMSLGRNTKHQVVDIDLGLEGSCSKVSRQQGMIKLHPGGSFYFQNLGQRKVRVDNTVIPSKRRAVLKNGSFLEVGGLRFIFLVNQKVVRAGLQ